VYRNEYDGDLLQSYIGIGRVAGALANEAESVYADILGGDAKETEIEAIFIRLVRLGDTSGATRRIARRGEFTDARWRMLQAAPYVEHVPPDVTAQIFWHPGRAGGLVTPSSRVVVVAPARGRYAGCGTDVTSIIVARSLIHSSSVIGRSR
jgi:hypothetical protein